jgi:hypothetical protein
MRTTLAVLFVSLSTIASADIFPAVCPSTVTSCTFTINPAGGSGGYQVSFYQNPAPFWETQPESVWSPFFKSLLTSSELASGQVPYNVEYDFLVGIDLANTDYSGQVTVDFQLPASKTNWLALVFPDDYGQNGGQLLTGSGQSTGGPGFDLPGSAWVTTATPGELIVTAGYNANAGGDLILSGMFIGEATTVPEPQTAWLLVAGAMLIAIVRTKVRAKT